MDWRLNRMYEAWCSLYAVLDVKRDHCTALWAVQHPSMTPTGFCSGLC